jgi:hypothetical protein
LNKTILKIKLFSVQYLIQGKLIFINALKEIDMTTGDEINHAADLPNQEKGSMIDVVEQAVFPLEDEARAFYQVGKERLLNVNHWGEASYIKLSTFELTDPFGEPAHRSAQEGDYIKIDIPGPGTSAGSGFDWVKIESIKEDSGDQTQLISMTVRPAPSPVDESGHVAHFLEDSATSTFMIRRAGNIVYAEEHGRNEVPNTETDQTVDNIRNTLVGWSAKLGMSYPQWKSLVKGFMKKE